MQERYAFGLSGRVDIGGFAAGLGDYGEGARRGELPSVVPIRRRGLWPRERGKLWRVITYPTPPDESR